MSSVTKRISEIKQPRGGYLKPSSMTITNFDDGKTLSDVENIHASLVGLAVDYMTRFIMSKDVRDAFSISISGAKIAQDFGKKNAVKLAESFVNRIKGLDDDSITAACKLVAFDVWFRDFRNASLSKTADEINPDSATIENIRIMVERSIKFLQEHGPVVSDGFTFEFNGYTPTVNSGDGDYIAGTTLWDFKVSKAKPTSKHTLQILMYWIMGQHSEKEIFLGVDSIGIFNPRLYFCYTMKISDIPLETIKKIEKDVICY